MLNTLCKELWNVLAKARSLRDKPNANFLVEYFQDLPARAALNQFTVKFQALNCLAAPDRDTQIQHLVLSRVIFARLCLRDDDMLNLRLRQESPGSEKL